MSSAFLKRHFKLSKRNDHSLLIDTFHSGGASAHYHILSPMSKGN